MKTTCAFTYMYLKNQTDKHYKLIMVNELELSSQLFKHQSKYNF